MFVELLAKVLLLGLAVWRVTSLVSNEKGPFDVFELLRGALGAYDLEPGFLGGLIECLWCSSIWVAVPAAVLIAPDLVWGVVVWLAISAVAILVDSSIPTE